MSASAAEPGAGRAWLRIVAWGLVYFLIGFLTVAITRHTASAGAVRTWRLASWLVSLGTFAACIGAERGRAPGGAPHTALRAALAVALGGFLLAAVATVHALSVHSARIVPQLIALVAWPLLLAVPAFLVAWAAAAVLGAMKKS